MNRRQLAHLPPTPAEAELAARLNYAGELWDEITVTGTVTKKEKVLSQRYSSLSTLLEIDCGTSMIVVFSSARWADATGLGEQITVTGTVKKLQCWHQIRETVLGRATRVDQALAGPTPADDQDAARRTAAGWPAGKAQVRRRFPDHPNPAAPPLFTLPATTEDA